MPVVRRRPLVSAGVLLVATGATAIAVRGADAPVAESPAPSRLPTTAEDRQDLVDGLDAGGAAGIAAYLVTHRSPASLAGATRFTTSEQHGTGPGGFRIGRVPAGGGRVTVLVVLRSQAVVRTTLTGGGHALLVRSGRQEAGALTAATIRFSARTPPSALRLDVLKGVVWGAAVVLSD